MADTALKTTAESHGATAPTMNGLSAVVLGIALVGLLAAPLRSTPSS